MSDKRDEVILMLCDRLYICSRLLTRAAERLSWDRTEVQELVVELRKSLEGCGYAGIEEDDNDDN